MTELQDRRIGQVLDGRYRIVRRLGAGGMGVVYEGEHLLIKRRVAIKTLHQSTLVHPDAVARFRREAMAATAVGNEHVVECTDMGSFEDGSLYMVLEYLEGRDLASDIKERGALSLGRAARLLCQACEALSEPHRKGIIHQTSSNLKACL